MVVNSSPYHAMQVPGCVHVFVALICLFAAGCHTGRCSKNTTVPSALHLLTPPTFQLSPDRDRQTCSGAPLLSPPLQRAGMAATRHAASPMMVPAVVRLPARMANTLADAGACNAHRMPFRWQATAYSV